MRLPFQFATVDFYEGTTRAWSDIYRPAGALLTEPPKYRLSDKISIPRHFRDTWRWAIGFDYRLAPKWRLQWGAATAKSAVPDSTYNGSIPTTDASWLTLGAQYTYSPTLGFGFGVNHIIFQNRNVNNTGSFGDTLRGTIDPGLDVIGAQVHWKM